MILSAAIGEVEIAKNNREAMKKFLRSVLLNFLLRASVWVITGWLRTGGITSRSSKSLSEVGLVRGWH